MAKQLSDTLEWTAGEIGVLVLTLKDAARDTYAALGGDTLTAKYAEDGEAYAEIGACSLNDGPNGIIDLTIDSTASALLTHGKYSIIIWLTRSAALVKAFGPARLIVSKG